MSKKINKEKLLSEFYMYSKGCYNGDEVYNALWKLVKESNFGGKEETLNEFTRKYYEMKDWVKATFDKVISRVNSIEGQTASLVVRRANKNEIKVYKKTWLYFKKFEHDFYDVFSISLSDTQYKLQQEEFWSKHSFAQKVDAQQ
ncbi:MAG: hypothetical protein IJW36_01190 [Clostridia bacterium]|nr:hypothetical protein [Clostridia bacterium]